MVKQLKTGEMMAIPLERFSLEVYHSTKHDPKGYFELAVLLRDDGNAEIRFLASDEFVRDVYVKSEQLNKSTNDMKYALAQLACVAYFTDQSIRRPISETSYWDRLTKFFVDLVPEVLTDAQIEIFIEYIEKVSKKSLDESGISLN